MVRSLPKKRVLLAIKELGYIPVKAAQTLRRQYTRVIGILVFGAIVPRSYRDRCQADTQETSLFWIDQKLKVYAFYIIIICAGVASGEPGPQGSGGSRAEPLRIRSTNVVKLLLR